MGRRIFTFALLLVSALAGQAIAVSPAWQSGRVVDRIVTRIEGDIILESQVRELGAFQQLVEEHAENHDQLLSELIEQWIVQTEAAPTRFPEPAQSEVDRELGRLSPRFGTAEPYPAKLREL